MTVYIMVFGGMGNQLFQILAGISYSLRERIPFKLVPIIAGTRRPFYFDKLLKSISVFIVNDRDKMLLARYPVYKDNEDLEYKLIPRIEDDFRCWGYFQSYKYFEHHLDKVMKLTRLDVQRNEIRAKYNNYEETTCLHFRLGDYKNLQEYHNVLNISYYKAAINKLVKLDDNVEKILIFGEENDKNQLQLNLYELWDEFPQIKFELIDYKIPDWEQMLIMSICKNNIIANSSFSAIAAHLNVEKRGNVLYPNRWFGPKNEDKKIQDMFRPEWIGISE